jgi:hypothetical protein
MPCGSRQSRQIYISFALLIFVTALQAQQAGRTGITDLDGRTADPLSANKVVVLVFLRRDCPVSSRYAPVIQQISKQFEQDASFWLVYPDKNDGPEDIRKDLADYGYHLPALRDADHALVKLGHVQITPEVAVFSRHHKLVYDGRIDNWYVALGNPRPAATTHELEEAIRATLSGKAVQRPEVRGVGCYISDLE